MLSASSQWACQPAGQAPCQHRSTVTQHQAKLPHSRSATCRPAHAQQRGTMLHGRNSLPVRTTEGVCGFWQSRDAQWSAPSPKSHASISRHCQQPKHQQEIIRMVDGSKARLPDRRALRLGDAGSDAKPPPALGRLGSALPGPSLPPSSSMPASHASHLAFYQELCRRSDAVQYTSSCCRLRGVPLRTLPARSQNTGPSACSNCQCHHGPCQSPQQRKRGHGHTERRLPRHGHIYGATSLMCVDFIQRTCVLAIIRLRLIRQRAHVLVLHWRSAGGPLHRRPLAGGALRRVRARA